MHRVKATNPFYVVLLAVGVVFAVTSCAYGVMTVRGLDPRLADEQGLMGLLSQHGLAILVVELVLLGVLTAAAIGTDGYWEGSRGPEIGRRRSAVAREGEALASEKRAEPLSSGDSL